jgi:diguanylate cyclase
VLRHLAKLLQGQVRSGETVARYGGEEFVILMPARPENDARDCLVRAQRELTRSVYLHESRKVFITFSAGLTQVRSTDSLESALARADEAMYRAKRAGKNCVSVA